MIITIDGPSASGKSTIACMLAHELNYFYLNTGMLYRGFAYAMLHDKPESEYLNEQDVAARIERLHYRWQQRATMHFKGVDITPYLNEKEIDQAASRFSAIPVVRKHIDAWQHALADHQDSVIDGRDSGSVVFVHADHKFYVTASDEIRAKRWLGKQLEQGREYTLANALEQIGSRDKRDMQRAVAPLIVPEGAKVICNDGDDPRATVEQILQLCRMKKKH